MNTLSKSITFILIHFLLITGSTYAHPEAEFLKIRKEFTLLPDNSLQVNYHKELKINSLMAINRLYGETFIPYNPDFQQLHINYSYTLLPGGDTLHTPSNAFNESLPPFAANAPAYSDLKEMIITHTGLEPGAIIHLDYTLSSVAAENNFLDIHEMLLQESPVHLYEIVINIPENQELNYQLLNIQTKPEQKNTPAGKRYSWTFRRLSPLPHEPFLTSDKSDLPHFMAHTYPSSKAALEVLYGHFQPTAGPEISEFTKTLTASAQNNIDKVFIIKDFINHQITLIPTPEEYLNRKIRSPEQVFSTAYGNRSEKINLFLAMLQSIGIKADIAAVYPASCSSPLGLAAITHLWVYTLADGFPLFLSPDERDVLSPGLRGKRDQIFLLSSGEIRPLTVLPHSAEIITQATLRINPQQVTSAGNIRLTGGLISPDRNIRYQEKIKEKINLPGDSVKILHHTLTSFRNELSFETQEKTHPQEGYYLYRLPEYGTGIQAWSLLPLPSKRRKNMELPHPIRESYDYTLQLSPELSAAVLPCQIRQKQGDNWVSVEIQQEGNRIRIHREINLSSAVITPKEYPSFRKLLNLWENPQYKTFILKDAGEK